MTEHRPLLDVLWPEEDRPDGFDHYGLKATRPDLRTRNGYRWPFPGKWARTTKPAKRLYRFYMPPIRG